MGTINCLSRIKKLCDRENWYAGKIPLFCPTCRTVHIESFISLDRLSLPGHSSSKFCSVQASKLWAVVLIVIYFSIFVRKSQVQVKIFFLSA